MEHPLPAEWYQLAVPEVLSELDSSATGLDEAAARERLVKIGANEIEFEKTPAWLRFLRQFNDPMIIILLITAAITGTLTALGSHMLPDTIVIVGVVLLNAILSFTQEEKADGALNALRELMVQEAMVLRGGEQQRIGDDGGPERAGAPC